LSVESRIALRFRSVSSQEEADLSFLVCRTEQIRTQDEMSPPLRQ
jgi:hypothetical protein